LDQTDFEIIFPIVLQIAVQGILIAWIAAMQNHQVTFPKARIVRGAGETRQAILELFHAQAFDRPTLRHPLADGLSPLAG
jgi:hypothetical protein